MKALLNGCLALCVSFAMTQAAGAQSDAPLTLNGIYGVTVQEAAERLFDVRDEVFVERLPVNPSPDAIVSGPDFFSVPKRISPVVCAFSVVSVHFDGMSAGQSPGDQRRALAKQAFAELPLRVRSVDRSSLYLVAGNAAASSNSCGGTPLALTTFMSSSDKTAIEGVANLRSVVRAARRPGPLPFRLTSACDGHWKACRDGRKVLGGLGPRRIESIVDGLQCQNPKGKWVAATPARRCIGIDFADEGGATFAGGHRSITIVFERDKVAEVRLWLTEGMALEGPGFLLP